ncbi:hypothetical protein PT974_11289 [Cladobotryum mycophilum]|uniref:Period circadian protein n=1 Tax=Cladobotryum mycophilum TaxID=491253 RepID=A0ABR0S666_9HYPO
MSSIVNKVKDILHSDNKSSEPEGTHGPHSTKAANVADPRIDSDRDHRENLSGHDGSYTSTDNYSYGGAGTAGTGTHGAGTHGTGTHNQSANRTGGPTTKTDGPHSSNLANKMDPRVDSDRDYSKNMGMNPSGTATTGTGTTGFNSQGRTSGTAGPHSSNLANKMDPLVDSDRDNSRNAGLHLGTGNYGTGTHGTGTHSTGTTGFSGGATGTHNTSGAPEGTYGPHSSRIANAADPLVDSDRDRSHNMPGGTTGVGGTTGFSGSNTGAGNTGGAFFNSGNTRTSGGAPEGTFGPHSSRVANAADPRVDSDRDNSRNMGVHSGTGTHGTGTHGAGTFGTSTHGAGNQGAGVQGTGTHGTGTHNTGTYGSSGAPEGTYGPHSSRVANAADPRVDSDRDNSRNMGVHSGTGTHGTGTHGTGTHGAGTTGFSGSTAGGAGGASGPAPNTAGPHKSDMLNKVDPRVDSDLDGSKTYGGDKTFNQSEGRTTTARDPTDAAQVPPSVLRKHIGEPTIEHNDAKHDRERRHSVSHQEQHRGL